jgi:DNA helicase-2/ATP-dependent DNA helicase PcrA
MRSLGDPVELEEERRLAYVGITRAEETLYLTRAWSRNLWGGNSFNPPSRFLREIPDQLTETVTRQKRSRLELAAGPQQRVEGADIGRGDRVRHAHWGDGVVEDITGEGDRAEAFVEFSAHGRKRLLLAWAPLEKV